MSSPFRAWSDSIPFSTVVAAPTPIFCRLRLLDRLLVAVCQPMPHIGRGQTTRAMRMIPASGRSLRALGVSCH
jgi:hypothetical protein